MTISSSLRGSYWLTVIFSLLALSPEFILSTALGQVAPEIATDLDTQQTWISMGNTLSTAALAIGAVVAADLAQRVRNRVLFLSYETVFIVGSLLAVFAPAAGFYVAGHILQGLATGMLLVAALPPLVTSFPVYRLKTTIPAVVIGLFGAVTAGPLVGGLIAQTGAWRLLFGVVLALGLLTFVLAAVALAERPALNPGMRVDVPAFALSIAGTLLLFYGAGQLMSYPWNAPQVYGPMGLGVAMLVALVVVEARQQEPLMPARPLSSTFPVIGILAAVISGAAFTSLTQLRVMFLGQVQGLEPLAAGLLFWPEVATGIVGALIVGVVLRTRWVLVMPFCGMLSLAMAAWMLTGVTAGTSSGVTLWISGLLGLGASLTVTPGLLMAALSVVPALVGRAIALVQLLRLTSAYLLAPVLAHFALTYGTQPEQLLTGLHTMFWVILGLLVGGIALISFIYLISNARLNPPGLENFLEEGEPALDSPPIREKPGSG